MSGSVNSLLLTNLQLKINPVLRKNIVLFCSILLRSFQRKTPKVVGLYIDRRGCSDAAIFSSQVSIHLSNAFRNGKDMIVENISNSMTGEVASSWVRYTQPGAGTRLLLCTLIIQLNLR